VLIEPGFGSGVPEDVAVAVAGGAVVVDAGGVVAWGVAGRVFAAWL